MYQISDKTSGTVAERRVVLDEAGEVVIAEAGRYEGSRYNHKYAASSAEKFMLLQLKRHFAGRQIISVPNGMDWGHVRFEIVP